MTDRFYVIGGGTLGFQVVRVRVYRNENNAADGWVVAECRSSREAYITAKALEAADDD